MHSNRSDVIAVFTLLSLLTVSTARAQPKPGNGDGDIDVDLMDVAKLQTCFTGPNADPDFHAPLDPQCLASFDVHGNDADIDRDDWGRLECALCGRERACFVGSRYDHGPVERRKG